MGIEKWYRRWPALGLVAMLMAAGTSAAEDSGRVPLPVVPEGQGKKCVEETPVIRRNHMRFLLHQRDATVHEGIRTPRHSLKECVQCHVQRDAEGRAIPINAPGQFCESCHSYAAVQIDCFTCHATTPDSGSPGLRSGPIVQAGTDSPRDQFPRGTEITADAKTSLSR